MLRGRVVYRRLSVALSLQAQLLFIAVLLLILASGITIALVSLNSNANASPANIDLPSRCTTVSTPVTSGDGKTAWVYDEKSLSDALRATDVGEIKLIRDVVVDNTGTTGSSFDSYASYTFEPTRKKVSEFKIDGCYGNRAAYLSSGGDASKVGMPQQFPQTPGKMTNLSGAEVDWPSGTGPGEWAVPTPGGGNYSIIFMGDARLGVGNIRWEGRNIGTTPLRQITFNNLGIRGRDEVGCMKNGVDARLEMHYFNVDITCSALDDYEGYNVDNKFYFDGVRAHLNYRVNGTISGGFASNASGPTCHNANDPLVCNAFVHDSFMDDHKKPTSTSLASDDIHASEIAVTNSATFTNTNYIWKAGDKYATSSVGEQDNVIMFWYGTASHMPEMNITNGAKLYIENYGVNMSTAHNNKPNFIGSTGGANSYPAINVGAGAVLTYEDKGLGASIINDGLVAEESKIRSFTIGNNAYVDFRLKGMPAGTTPVQRNSGASMHTENITVGDGATFNFITDFALSSNSSVVANNQMIRTKNFEAGQASTVNVAAINNNFSNNVFTFEDSGKFTANNSNLTFYNSRPNSMALNTLSGTVTASFISNELQYWNFADAQGNRQPGGLPLKISPHAIPFTTPDLNTYKNKMWPLNSTGVFVDGDHAMSSSSWYTYNTDGTPFQIDFKFGTNGAYNVSNAQSFDSNCDPQLAYPNTDPHECLYKNGESLSDAEFKAALSTMNQNQIPIFRMRSSSTKVNTPTPRIDAPYDGDRVISGTVDEEAGKTNVVRATYLIDFNGYKWVQVDGLPVVDGKWYLDTTLLNLRQKTTTQPCHADTAPFAIAAGNCRVTIFDYDTSKPFSRGGEISTTTSFPIDGGNQRIEYFVTPAERNERGFVTATNFDPEDNDARRSTEVQEFVLPWRVSDAPSINEYWTTDLNVTGSGVPGSVITLQVFQGNSNNTRCASVTDIIVVSDSTWTYAIPEACRLALYRNDTIRVWQQSPYDYAASRKNIKHQLAGHSIEPTDAWWDKSTDYGITTVLSTPLQVGSAQKSIQIDNNWVVGSSSNTVHSTVSAPHFSVQFTFPYNTDNYGEVQIDDIVPEGFEVIQSGVNGPKVMVNNTEQSVSAGTWTFRQITSGQYQGRQLASFRINRSYYSTSGDFSALAGALFNIELTLNKTTYSSLTNYGHPTEAGATKNLTRIMINPLIQIGGSVNGIVPPEDALNINNSNQVLIQSPWFKYVLAPATEDFTKSVRNIDIDGDSDDAYNDNPGSTQVIEYNEGVDYKISWTFPDDLSNYQNIRLVDYLPSVLQLYTGCAATSCLQDIGNPGNRQNVTVSAKDAVTGAAATLPVASLTYTAKTAPEPNEIAYEFASVGGTFTYLQGKVFEMVINAKLAPGEIANQASPAGNSAKLFVNEGTPNPGPDVEVDAPPVVVQDPPKLSKIYFNMNAKNPGEPDDTVCANSAGNGGLSATESLCQAMTENYVTRNLTTPLSNDPDYGNVVLKWDDAKQMYFIEVPTDRFAINMTKNYLPGNGVDKTIEADKQAQEPLRPNHYFARSWSTSAQSCTNFLNEGTYSTASINQNTGLTLYACWKPKQIVDFMFRNNPELCGDIYYGATYTGGVGDAVLSGAGTKFLPASQNTSKYYVLTVQENRGTFDSGIIYFKITNPLCHRTRIEAQGGSLILSTPDATSADDTEFYLRLSGTSGTFASMIDVFYELDQEITYNANLDQTNPAVDATLRSSYEAIIDDDNNPLTDPEKTNPIIDFGDNITSFTQSCQKNTNCSTKDGFEHLKANNYYFDHWNTAPDNTGTSYDGNKVYQNIDAAQATTLYAIWSPKYTYIVYNRNLGTGAPPTTTICYYSKPCTLATTVGLKAPNGKVFNEPETWGTSPTRNAVTGPPAVPAVTPADIPYKYGPGQTINPYSGVFSIDSPDDCPLSATVGTLGLPATCVPQANGKGNEITLYALYKDVAPGANVYSVPETPNKLEIVWTTFDATLPLDAPENGYQYECSNDPDFGTDGHKTPTNINDLDYNYVKGWRIGFVTPTESASTNVFVDIPTVAYSAADASMTELPSVDVTGDYRCRIRGVRFESTPNPGHMDDTLNDNSKDPDNPILYGLVSTNSVHFEKVAGYAENAVDYKVGKNSNKNLIDYNSLSPNLSTPNQANTALVATNTPYTLITQCREGFTHIDNTYREWSNYAAFNASAFTSGSSIINDTLNFTAIDDVSGASGFDLATTCYDTASPSGNWTYTVPDKSVPTARIEVTNVYDNETAPENIRWIMVDMSTSLVICGSAGIIGNTFEPDITPINSTFYAQMFSWGTTKTCNTSWTSSYNSPANLNENLALVLVDEFYDVDTSIYPNVYDLTKPLSANYVKYIVDYGTNDPSLPDTSGILEGDDPATSTYLVIEYYKLGTNFKVSEYPTFLYRKSDTRSFANTLNAVDCGGLTPLPRSEVTAQSDCVISASSNAGKEFTIRLNGNGGFLFSDGSYTNGSIEWTMQARIGSSYYDENFISYMASCINGAKIPLAMREGFTRIALSTMGAPVTCAPNDSISSAWLFTNPGTNGRGAGEARWATNSTGGAEVLALEDLVNEYKDRGQTIPDSGAIFNYYLGWTENKLTINYSNNGGSGTLASTNCDYAFTNPACVLKYPGPNPAAPPLNNATYGNFTKTGYIVDSNNWYEFPAADGHNYYAGSSAKSFAGSDGGLDEIIASNAVDALSSSALIKDIIVTLYARYNPKTVVIHYGTNGGDLYNYPAGYNLPDTVCTYNETCVVNDYYDMHTNFTRGYKQERAANSKGDIAAVWTMYDGASSPSLGDIPNQPPLNYSGTTYIAGNDVMINANSWINSGKTDVSFFARYSPYKLTIQYVKQLGGVDNATITGTVVNTECNYGRACNLRATTLTRPGYTQTGWKLVYAANSALGENVLSDIRLALGSADPSFALNAVFGSNGDNGGATYYADATVKVEPLWNTNEPGKINYQGNNKSGQVVASWDVPNGVSTADVQYYEYQCSNSSTMTPIVAAASGQTANGTTTQVLFTGLTTGSEQQLQFYCHLRIQTSSSGLSSWGDITSFTLWKNIPTGLNFESAQVADITNVTATPTANIAYLLGGATYSITGQCTNYYDFHHWTPGVVANVIHEINMQSTSIRIGGAGNITYICRDIIPPFLTGFRTTVPDPTVPVIKIDIAGSDLVSGQKTTWKIGTSYENDNNICIVKSFEAVTTCNWTVPNLNREYKFYITLTDEAGNISKYIRGYEPDGVLPPDTNCVDDECIAIYPPEPPCMYESDYVIEGDCLPPTPPPPFKLSRITFEKGETGSYTRPTPSTRYFVADEVNLGTNVLAPPFPALPVGTPFPYTFAKYTCSFNAYGMMRGVIALRSYNLNYSVGEEIAGNMLPSSDINCVGNWLQNGYHAEVSIKGQRVNADGSLNGDWSGTNVPNNTNSMWYDARVADSVQIITVKMHHLAFDQSEFIDDALQLIEGQTPSGIVNVYIDNGLDTANTGKRPVGLNGLQYISCGNQGAYQSGQTSNSSIITASSLSPIDMNGDSYCTIKLSGDATFKNADQWLAKSNAIRYIPSNDDILSNDGDYEGDLHVHGLGYRVVNDLSEFENKTIADTPKIIVRILPTAEEVARYAGTSLGITATQFSSNPYFMPNGLLVVNVEFKNNTHSLAPTDPSADYLFYHPCPFITGQRSPVCNIPAPANMLNLRNPAGLWPVSGLYRISSPFSISNTTAPNGQGTNNGAIFTATRSTNDVKTTILSKVKPVLTITPLLDEYGDAIENPKVDDNTHVRITVAVPNVNGSRIDSPVSGANINPGIMYGGGLCVTLDNPLANSGCYYLDNGQTEKTATEDIYTYIVNTGQLTQGSHRIYASYYGDVLYYSNPDIADGEASLSTPPFTVSQIDPEFAVTGTGGIRGGDPMSYDRYATILIGDVSKISGLSNPRGSLQTFLYKAGQDTPFTAYDSFTGTGADSVGVPGQESTRQWCSQTGTLQTSVTPEDTISPKTDIPGWGYITCALPNFKEEEQGEYEIWVKYIPAPEEDVVRGDAQMHWIHSFYVQTPSSMVQLAAKVQVAAGGAPVDTGLVDPHNITNNNGLVFAKAVDGADENEKKTATNIYPQTGDKNMHKIGGHIWHWNGTEPDGLPGPEINDDTQYCRGNIDVVFLPVIDDGSVSSINDARAIKLDNLPVDAFTCQFEFYLPQLPISGYWYMSVIYNDDISAGDGEFTFDRRHGFPDGNIRCVDPLNQDGCTVGELVEDSSAPSLGWDQSMQEDNFVRIFVGKAGPTPTPDIDPDPDGCKIDGYEGESGDDAECEDVTGPDGTPDGETDEFEAGYIAKIVPNTTGQVLPCDTTNFTAYKNSPSDTEKPGTSSIDCNVAKTRYGTRIIAYNFPAGITPYNAKVTTRLQFDTISASLGRIIYLDSGDAQCKVKPDDWDTYGSLGTDWNGSTYTNPAKCSHMPPWFTDVDWQQWEVISMAMDNQVFSYVPANGETISNPRNYNVFPENKDYWEIGYVMQGGLPVGKYTLTAYIGDTSQLVGTRTNSFELNVHKTRPDDILILSGANNTLQNYKTSSLSGDDPTVLNTVLDFQTSGSMTVGITNGEMDYAIIPKSDWEQVTDFDALTGYGLNPEIDYSQLVNKAKFCTSSSAVAGFGVTYSAPSDSMEDLYNTCQGTSGQTVFDANSPQKPIKSTSSGLYYSGLLPQIKTAGEYVLLNVLHGDDSIEDTILATPFTVYEEDTLVDMLKCNPEQYPTFCADSVYSSAVDANSNNSGIEKGKSNQKVYVRVASAALKTLPIGYNAGGTDDGADISYTGRTPEPAGGTIDFKLYQKCTLATPGVDDDPGNQMACTFLGGTDNTIGWKSVLWTGLSPIVGQSHLWGNSDSERDVKVTDISNAGVRTQLYPGTAYISKALPIFTDTGHYKIVTCYGTASTPTKPYGDDHGLIEPKCSADLAKLGEEGEGTEVNVVPPRNSVHPDIHLASSVKTITVPNIHGITTPESYNPANITELKGDCNITEGIQNNQDTTYCLPWSTDATNSGDSYPYYTDLGHSGGLNPTGGDQIQVRMHFSHQINGLDEPISGRVYLLVTRSDTANLFGTNAGSLPTCTYSELSSMSVCKISVNINQNTSDATITVPKLPVGGVYRFGYTYDAAGTIFYASSSGEFSNADANIANAYYEGGYPVIKAIPEINSSATTEAKNQVGSCREPADPEDARPLCGDLNGATIKRFTGDIHATISAKVHRQPAAIYYGPGLAPAGGGSDSAVTLRIADANVELYHRGPGATSPCTADNSGCTIVEEYIAPYVFSRFGSVDGATNDAYYDANILIPKADIDMLGAYELHFISLGSTVLQLLEDGYIDFTVFDDTQVDFLVPDIYDRTDDGDIKVFEAGQSVPVPDALCRKVDDESEDTVCPDYVPSGQLANNHHMLEMGEQLPADKVPNQRDINQLTGLKGYNVLCWVEISDLVTNGSGELDPVKWQNIKDGTTNPHFDCETDAVDPAGTLASSEHHWYMALFSHYTPGGKPGDKFPDCDIDGNCSYTGEGDPDPNDPGVTIDCDLLVDHPEWERYCPDETEGGNNSYANRLSFKVQTAYTYLLKDPAYNKSEDIYTYPELEVDYLMPSLMHFGDVSDYATEDEIAACASEDGGAATVPGHGCDATAQAYARVAGQSLPTAAAWRYHGEVNWFRTPYQSDDINGILEQYEHLASVSGTGFVCSAEQYSQSHLAQCDIANNGGSVPASVMDADPLHAEAQLTQNIYNDDHARTLNAHGLNLFSNFWTSAQSFSVNSGILPLNEPNDGVVGGQTINCDDTNSTMLQPGTGTTGTAETCIVAGRSDPGLTGNYGGDIVLDSDLEAGVHTVQAEGVDTPFTTAISKYQLYADESEHATGPGDETDEGARYCVNEAGERLPFDTENTCVNGGGNWRENPVCEIWQHLEGDMINGFKCVPPGPPGCEVGMHFDRTKGECVPDNALEETGVALESILLLILLFMVLLAYSILWRYRAQKYRFIC